MHAQRPGTPIYPFRGVLNRTSVLNSVNTGSFASSNRTINRTEAYLDPYYKLERSGSRSFDNDWGQAGTDLRGSFVVLLVGFPADLD